MGNINEKLPAIFLEYFDIVKWEQLPINFPKIKAQKGKLIHENPAKISGAHQILKMERTAFYFSTFWSSKR